MKSSLPFQNKKAFPITSFFQFLRIETASSGLVPEVAVLNRFKDGRSTSYTTKDGLSNDVVAAIYEDQDKIVRRRSGSFILGRPLQCAGGRLGLF
jgi:hypothetical protein